MRVLILEDDPWIADLLKQIILSLRPGARVACLASVAAALEAWQREAAQLVIADWNLPDGNGTRLLEAVRRTDPQVPLVVVTAHADRDRVMAVRPLGISAFIIKPFQVPKVLECLQRLLPGDDTQHESPQTEGDFAVHLAELAGEALDLPLSDELHARLQGTDAPPTNLPQLGEHWQSDPAVQALLIAAANSSGYNRDAQPCVSLAEALQRLGQATALNLIQGLALRPAAKLQDADLLSLGQEQLQLARQAQQRVSELASACRLDPAPLQSAALLQRMGELAVLRQAQLWRNRGLPLESEQVQESLRQYSSELANRLKAHWRLPTALRELIGACYGLPPGNTRREPILMRLACIEQQGEDSSELQRLRRLAGLA